MHSAESGERSTLINKELYGERDYAFGQRILTLRTQMGLTQTALAEQLHISRRAVTEWEAGSSYPKSEHLQKLITLGVRTSAFSLGREAEEIRVLWKAAHQKILLNEVWLANLLKLTPSMPQAESITIPSPQRPQVDWGEAPIVPNFYGRKSELTTLVHWVVEERCQMVSVLGMGGIGKSALATTVMHQVAEQFEVVIWHSLRDRPSCAVLINDCLQVLTPHVFLGTSTSSEGRLQLLMEQLRTQRVLLVFDNLEMLLEEGTGAGRMRAGFEDYALLLRHVGETAHQSCLLLTSREKPVILVPLEGRRSSVRTLRLTGLDREAGVQLLEEKDVTSPPHELGQLVEMYQGNPLALKIVAHTIMEVFGGEIAPFLQQGEIVFGGVRQLLDEQFIRLSALEQTVLLWLAILREPVSLQTLLAILNTPISGGQVLEAVEGLRRCSLIEQGRRAGSFTLQSVVLQYATTRLIEEGSHEIEQGQLLRLLEHGLCLAQAKEYVRQTQEHLLVAPLLTVFQSTCGGYVETEARLLCLLDELRSRSQGVQGYGPANLVSLLRVLRGHLRSLDLSRLALRDVFLQGIDMQDSTLSHTMLQECVFTEPFDALMATTMSRTGTYWAAATSRGEIRVWDDGGRTLRHAWRAHTEMIWGLAFSPDERMLTSACANGNIRLWDVNSSRMLWESWPAQSLTSIAFSPNGDVLASGGGLNALVWLWDPQYGTLLGTLPHANAGAIAYVTWSPIGRLLASGCADGSIWLWDSEMLDTPVRVLSAHTGWVTGLSFSPDATQLASASYDGMVKLWDLTTGTCLQTFSEHTAPVLRVAWSPDGRTLASCGYDTTIRFWNIQTGRASRVLQGHADQVNRLVFTPDSRILLSSSYDDTLRVWDVQSGQCVRIIEGHTVSLVDLDWSPDGTQLASCGADTQVTLWDAASGASHNMLQGHHHIMQGVAWSSDGQLLASGGQDGLRLWDPVTSVCLHEWHALDMADTVFQGVAWSPRGHLLAAGSTGRGVQVWETTTGNRLWVGGTQVTRVRRVAWSPDGRLLVGGGYDGLVYVWNANDGTLQWQLEGHQGKVMSVAWSPDGRHLASGGGRKGGELFVWEGQSGERMHSLTAPSEAVSAVVWSPDGTQLISGDSDGKLCWWEVESKKCLWVQEGHQGMVQALKVSPDGSTLGSCGDDGAIRLWNLHSGELLRTLRRDRPYERLNITGIKGLTQAQLSSLQALGAVMDTSTDGS